MPLWGWVLGLGAVGYFLYKGSGTTPSTGVNAAPPPPPGGWSTGPVAVPGTYTPGVYPTVPPTSGAQPVAAPPATPDVSSGSASGPLYSTGYYDVHTGAELVQDALGRTFRHR